MCAAVRQQRNTYNSQYETHFYCALCGGPFAKVFRTAHAPANVRPHDDSNTEVDGEDEDPDNIFNYPSGNDENRVIPEEAVLQTMGRAARRSRDARRRAEECGKRPGIMSEQRTTWQAYDGRRISTKQMKWTRNLRALINRRAIRQPLDQFHNTEGVTAYLTGRGLVREDKNWADAFASVDDEDEQAEADSPEDAEARRANTEYPYFSQSAIENNTYGFHLYQELGGDALDYVISSIPFHDECMSLLDLAIDDSGKERGIENMNDEIDVDLLWEYFRNLVGVGGEQKVADQFTFAVLQNEHRREVVMRLGEVDYREAQRGGDGWYWRHEEGCHWLAADPSLYSVLDEPLKKSASTSPLPSAPRAALADPFMSLPAEVILEVTQFLTSTDTFSLKTASPAVQNIALPESYYRRFLREEFRYLPTLLKEIEGHERAPREGRNVIDWRGSFERLRRLIKTPKVSSYMEEPSSKWDEVDIGLKNRNRIWKIVKPMAEELVETSAAVMRERHGAPKATAGLISVVRGYLGTRSACEGAVHTAYFGSKGKLRERQQPIERDEENEEDGDALEEIEIAASVGGVRVWFDEKDGPICGLGFCVIYQAPPEFADEFQPSLQWFGRRGKLYIDVRVPSKEELTGFMFCWSGSIISGVQLAFRTGDEADITYSRRVGLWNGGVRKIIVPSYWRKLVGVTGFVNSSGFIEKVGLLEESPLRDNFGSLGPAPRTVPLFHEEASVWKKVPPNNVKFLEREGINVPDWRVCPADWEVWESGHQPEGVSEMGGSDYKDLREIVGHYDDEFLRGLEFVYSERRTRRQFRSVMGSLKAAKRSSISLKPGDSIVAIVLCFSGAGVHGILFLTNRNVSEMFGPRYMGTHKVYAPAPDVLNHGRPRNPYRHEVMNKFLGLHGIYDDQAKVFLQLGIIQLPLGEYSVFNPPIPRAIPFDEVDNQLSVWSDGPPPEDWIIGGKPDAKYGSMDPFRQTPPFPDYTGWAQFEGLREITIYGEMKGIRFHWGDGVPDRFFGCVDGQVTGLQKIDFENGECVIGIAVRKEELDDNPLKFTADNDAVSIISASSQDEGRPCMERLLFVTNSEEDNEEWIKIKVENENYLVGIKLDFFPDRLVNWAPAYAPNPNIHDGTQMSYRSILETVRFPWKRWRPEEDVAIADTAWISNNSWVVCTYFDDEELGYPDAIKGYVSIQGHFCGLLLRRNGVWSKEVFGQRSAYELPIDLARGEKITSFYLSSEKTEKTRDRSDTIVPLSVALATSHGNISPWLGRLGDHIRLHAPPPGHVAVGMYGAVEEIPAAFRKYRWYKVGLLYKKQEAAPTVEPPAPPAKSACHVTDVGTKLPWFNIAMSCTPDFHMAKLVLMKHELYRRKPEIGRAYTIFEPAKLEQIRVFLNETTGIRSIRFRGTPDMGLTTMGEWPVDDENIKLTKDQKMKIDGPRGERIIRVKVAFQRREIEDRIVGLDFETSYGRTQTIVSSELYPERPVDFGKESVKVLQTANPNEEIVGLHGIVGLYNIHDIGLVYTKNRSTAAGGARCMLS